MLDFFFVEFGILNLDLYFGVGGGFYGVMIGWMFEQFDLVFEDMGLDWVFVYGDINLIIVGIFLVVKMYLLVVYLEVGLCFFNCCMFEEYN